MDESTFQRELVQLKHRVAQMTGAYHQRLPALPPPPPSPSTLMMAPDVFASHLDEVKFQLRSMQASLQDLAAERCRPSIQHIVQPNPAMAHRSALLPPPHSHVSLPSGPIFWQLFSSLRTDVRGIESRVASLEQDVSNLEDKVDGLDPHRFTPPSSEDSSPTGSACDHYLHPSQQNVYQIPSLTQPQEIYSPSTLHYNFSTSSQNYAELHSDYQGESANQAAVPAPEGVAFRDKEIAQLEEQFLSVQDTLKQNEDLVSQQDAQIQHLSSERRAGEAQIAELNRLRSEQQDLISTYRQELGQLRTECQSKDASLHATTSQHRAMQQSFLRKKTQLSAADRQIQQLQRAMYNLQGSKQDAIDGIAASKEEEIGKLHEFCEAKEAVVQQQEQIISRGAKIIQERDDEITKLGRQLKAANEHCQNEIRERERFAKLLDERDDELTRLRACLRRALGPFSSFATDRGDARKGHEQWTPKAFDKHVRLAHEQERALVWDKSEGQAHNKYAFGVPGVCTAPPTQQQEQTGPNAGNVSSHDLRRTDSLKVLQRLALVEEGSKPPAAPVTEKASSPSSRRHKLPLDLPPLPAPKLLHRKLASVTDLRRGGDETGAIHEHPLSRHQSLQDVPRRKWQAYVETGDA